MAAQDSIISIRPARPSDSAAVSRICLLTGDAGTSAEALHTIPELPGLFYACPYVQLPYASGFVLVRQHPQRNEDAVDDVLGYVLFAYDSRAFENALEREWFPPLQTKYPNKIEPGTGTSLTDADKRYISLLHAPDRAPDACVAFSPAHLHIDILPEAQRQGWGRQLIDSAVKHLRDEKGLKSVWLGMDPRNLGAARFYERLGFQAIEGAPDNYVGLNFENWTSA